MTSFAAGCPVTYRRPQHAAALTLQLLTGPRYNRGPQYLQVGGIHVGNGPQLQPTLNPPGHVVAIVPQYARQGWVCAGGPDKHVDDVLSSPIDDGGHHPALYVVEPATHQGETLVSQLEHWR